LDPTSVAQGLWHWSGGTPSWFGIPFENYLSWYLGSAIVLSLYLVLDREGSDDAQPIFAYGAVALSFLASPVAAATLVLMGGATLAALLRRPPRERRVRLSPEWEAPPAQEAVRALRREDFLRHPVKNHFVNTLHIVVAHGERYMIANIRRVRAQLS